MCVKPNDLVAKSLDEFLVFSEDTMELNCDLCGRPSITRRQFKHLETKPDAFLIQFIETELSIPQELFGGEYRINSIALYSGSGDSGHWSCV